MTWQDVREHKWRVLALVVIAIAVIFAPVMTLEERLAWATVGLGLVLTEMALRAVFYFRRQRELAGGSWILEAFHRTALTVTAACAWFTLARALTLAFGRSPLLSIIGGVIVVWLLLIPPMLEMEFRSHEGRRR
jgi:hypothetical protein